MIEQEGSTCALRRIDTLAAYDGTARGMQTLPTGCSGWRKLSRDGCVLTMSEDCNSFAGLARPLVRARVVGDLRFAYTTDSVTGVLQVDLDDGQSVCTAELIVSGVPR
jgi:hypothetical protein